jgi:hypothetical protein
VTGDEHRHALEQYLSLDLPIRLTPRHTLVSGDIALLISRWEITGRTAEGCDVHLTGTTADVARLGEVGWRLVIDKSDRHGPWGRAVIHHISIPGTDPRHLAEVIVELFDGTLTRFGPNAGSWIAWPGDDVGTAIEVHPRGAELYPPDGSGQAQFRHDPTASGSPPPTPPSRSNAPPTRSSRWRRRKAGEPNGCPEERTTTSNSGSTGVMSSRSRAAGIARLTTRG